MNKQRLELDDIIAKRMIAFERERQNGKGWTPQHDDQHANGELTYARLAYSAAAGIAHTQDIELIRQAGLPYWPWEPSSFKPSLSANRNWVKAGALALAEVERAERVPDDKTRIKLELLQKRVDFCASKITNPVKDVSELIMQMMLDMGHDKDEAAETVAEIIKEVFLDN